MTRLAIHMLGPFHVLLGESPVWGFKTVKDRILLAYLADKKNQPIRREKLAELLWPERPQGAALANLRHTLSTLRKVIHDQNEASPYLIISRQFLQLNPCADIWTDMAHFEFLLNQECPPESLVGRLEQAVCFYSGAFMEGLSTNGSLELEGWIKNKRALVYQEFMLALNKLVKFWEEQKEYGKAIPFAYRRVEQEPWSERANHCLIRLLLLDGQHGQALSHYEIFCKVLNNELGTQPSEATQELYKKITLRSTTVKMLP